jgi:predicted O-methyltransferase YrrM
MLMVKNAIEVGVFAGYSALAMALALPKDGRLLACDLTDRFIGIGREHWEAAGVAHKIDVRIAPWSRPCISGPPVLVS